MSILIRRRGFFQRNGWFWLLTAMLAGVVGLMFRGGGAYYWGPVQSDLTNQFYPWAVFVRRWLAQGVMPFWDPHVFSGYPVIETQQMLALNPIHLITKALSPELGLIAAAAAHTVVAGWGMAWGLWRWGRCSQMAAVAGAAIYVFGALFAVRVMAGHFTVIAAMAWWPLAVMSVLRITRLMGERGAGSGGVPWVKRVLGHWAGAMRSARLRRLMILSAVFHGMVCLAGGPQYMVYLFFIDVVVVMAAARRGVLFGALAACASVWVMALVVSAPQWLPTTWYLPLTARGQNSSGATGLSFIPLLNIGFETLLPFPFGDDLGRGHLHFKNVWETALYPGVLALALAVGGVLRVGAWSAGRMLGTGRFVRAVSPVQVAGVTVLAAGLYMMIGGWLPGFGGFRDATKARAVVAFALALLTATGIDDLLRSRQHWISWIYAAGWLAVAGCAWLVYLGMDVERFATVVKSFGPPFDPLAWDNYAAFLENPADAFGVFRRAGLYVAVVASVVGLAVMVLRGAGRGWLACAVLCVAVMADPLAMNARAWVGRHAWDQQGLPENLRDYFGPLLEERREVGGLPWRVILEPAVINRTHHTAGLYESYGYDPLMPAFGTSRMLVKGSATTHDDNSTASRAEFMARAGVRYDASKWDGDPDRIIEAPGAALFEVARRVAAESPGAHRFGPDMDGVHYVLPASLGGNIEEVPDVPGDFQQEIASHFGGAGPGGLAESESLEYVETGRPDEWAVAVKLEQPGLVVLKTTWLPGWTAYIDGESQGRALFANNWMCGAIVPAGDHEVLFRYRPVAWGLSLGIAGAGLMVLLAGWRRWGVRR